MTREGQTIALIGGGRWGRVHASNLARLLTSRDRVLWVSRRNRQALEASIAGLVRPQGPQFGLFADIHAALAERPTAALVVTAPLDHVSDAELLLRHRVPTFVEKPLALGADDAARLIRLARDQDRILAVGLHLLSASYLAHFKAMLAGRTIGRLDIQWLDAASETRYGESKQGDLSTPLAHDIYPHVWSLVRVLTGCGTQAIEDVTLTDGGISLRSGAADVAVTAVAGRRAPARVRRIDVVLTDGGSAALDFTCEPGTPVVDGVPREPDPAWGTGPTPLVAEVQAFLGQIAAARRDDNWPHLAAHCLDSIAGAEQLAAKIEHRQLEWLRHRCAAGSAAIEDQETLALVTDLLAPMAAKHGLRLQSLGDTERRSVVQEALGFVAERIGSTQAEGERDAEVLRALADLAQRVAGRS